MKKKFYRWQIFERYLGMVFLSLATLMMVVLAIKFFVISPGRVNGRSMEPNFSDENIFFVNRLSFLLHQPERFDVVQVIEPIEKKLIIKRIIGLPGEIVVIKRGKVFVTKDLHSVEIELDESKYLASSIYTTVPIQDKPIKYLVGDDQYFIMGDNRMHSTDSRAYGPVGREVIVGKVVVK